MEDFGDHLRAMRGLEPELTWEQVCSDANANRNDRVWHGATENGP